MKEINLEQLRELEKDCIAYRELCQNDFDWEEEDEL